MNYYKIFALLFLVFYIAYLISTPNIDDKHNIVEVKKHTHLEDKNISLAIFTPKKIDISYKDRDVKRVNYSAYTVEKLIFILKNHDGQSIKTIMKVLWMKAIDENQTSLALESIKKIKNSIYEKDIIDLATLISQDLENFSSSQDINKTKTLDILNNQLFCTDPNIRLNAVKKLSNYRDNKSLVILKQALNDETVRVRLQAVKALWYMAADGYSDNGEVIYNLSLMQNDIDEKVSSTAKMALEDLKNIYSKEYLEYFE